MWIFQSIDFKNINEINTKLFHKLIIGFADKIGFYTVLIISNKMKQYAGIYLLQNHSTYFGCPSHPSSRVHKIVPVAPGTGHSIWAKSFLQLDQIWTRWRKAIAQIIIWPVPEAAVTILCTLDDGCDGHPKHVESDFAVNKYLHTVASCWILLI